ncbi:MAG: hypothetical protein IRY99_14635 [Isosphaeraceae bacterium]|nr:hypothetical protein [Isosphaeraceae bacterium]
MFFQGNNPVHQTMHRLAMKLEEAGIPYALVGGLALNAHGHRCPTDDVNFLLNQEGYERFLKRLDHEELDPVPDRPRRFIDRDNGVPVNLLITGHYPGPGKPGPIVYPDPGDVAVIIEDIRVVDLPTLIDLKLAAGRFRDLADVVELIKIHDLDENFAERLHPALRRKYLACLEEKRSEDEHEILEGAE